MRIPSELLSQLSTAILRLHAPSHPREIPATFLGIIRELLECEHFTYQEFGPDYYCCLNPILDPELTERFVTLLDQHPSISHIRRTQTTNAVKISDLISTREWQMTDLYNEIFVKVNTQYQLGFMFSTQGVEVGFAANRHRRDFSEIHRFILNALAPHLSQAIQNAAAVARLDRAVDSSTGGGTVVCDNNGVVLFCSRKAADCVARFFGPILNNKLPDDLYGWVKAILGNSDFGNLSFGALAPLMRTQEKSSLTVRFQPNHLISEHILVFEEQVQALPFSKFKDFGLTNRQVEVLNWVTQAKTNSEIALILGISVRTVDHHVEHIMAKLGVERRGGAALWAQQTLRMSGNCNC
jgi:DNA-binding CsgD family transcriptional regulator